MEYKYEVGDMVTIRVPKLNEEGIDALVGFKPPRYYLELDGREYKISDCRDYFCAPKDRYLPLYDLDGSFTDSTGTIRSLCSLGFDEHWLLPAQPDIADSEVEFFGL